jgi:hypothetical protein
MAGAPDAEAVTLRLPALGNRRIVPQGIDTASVCKTVTPVTQKKEYVVRRGCGHYDWAGERTCGPRALLATGRSAPETDALLHGWGPAAAPQ